MLIKYLLLELLEAWYRREYTLHDVFVKLNRLQYRLLQIKYNFYVSKTMYINNMKGTHTTIMLLIGKYHQLWDVTFRRLYEYSNDLDVVVVNAGGLHSDKAIKLSREYGFSYFESYPNNFVSAQNYVLKYIIKSPLVLKVDDDVFVTKYTIRNLLSAYKRIREKGSDIGFLSPVVNVNNVSYYHFLKTLNLIEEYEKLFEKPNYIRNWRKQMIWYDPRAAMWIWSKSLPLNEVAEVFNEVNSEKIELIPLRFSISCILFTREFILSRNGFMSYEPSLIKTKNVLRRMIDTSTREKYLLLMPYGDEESINFYADTSMHGRFLILDSFVGHLSYYPQSDVMIKWFELNKERFLEDLKE